MQVLVNHEMEEAGREPQCVDLVALQRVAQIFRRSCARRHDDQSRAVQKTAPDLECRGVEGRGRELQERLCAGEVCVVGILDQTHDAAMFDVDTFGPAGRA